MPKSRKHIAKIIISRNAIEAFIKCLKQTGFVCRMKNYAYFLIFLNFKIVLLLFIFFILTRTQNNAIYHLIKACSDF